MIQKNISNSYFLNYNNLRFAKDFVFNWDIVKIN